MDIAFQNISYTVQNKQNISLLWCKNQQNLIKAIKETQNNRKAVLITDQNVFEAQKETILGFNVPYLVLPAGESTKSTQFLAKIHEFCFQNSLDRKSVVIAFGGGVIGDVTGFAAATYLRGITLFQVPTSLLSMVDSSIGGKTGINTTYGKNLLGAMHQPEAIFTCPPLLQTLKTEELRHGMAEMLKHGIITDKNHFENLKNIALKNNQEKKPKWEEITPFILDSAQIKMNIVENDAFEAKNRMKLNLGHTFGHAIERLSGYKMPHGQAVGIGLVMAAEFAHEKNICNAKTVQEITKTVEMWGLPTKSKYKTEAIWENMAHDKKKSGKKLTLILPKKIGEVCFYEKSV